MSEVALDLDFSLNYDQSWNQHSLLNNNTSYSRYNMSWAKDNLGIDNLPCFSTRPCIISLLFRTLSAQTNPLLRSLAKYTRPNFPFPNGRPISNIPRWNDLGGVGFGGIEMSVCSVLATSSNSLDDTEGGFGSCLRGAIEPGRCKAWEVSNAVLRRFDRFEVCTSCMLEKVTPCLRLDIVVSSKWI